MSTRAQIATAAREYLEEIDSGITVTGTIMANAINRAQRELNRETEYNRHSRALAITTGTREYTISSTHTKLYRVCLGTGSSRIRLDPTSTARLDSDEPGWDAATAGTPSYYYADGKYLGLHPKPHEAAAAGTVYYKALVTPPDLSAAGSSPSWCPDEYHDTIAKRTAVDLAGGFLATTDGSPNRGAWLYDQYLADVREMKRLAVRRSQEYTGGFRPTGYGSFRR